jgi:Sulfotransferase family
MTVHKHLVALQGVPRSGTSWLGQIFKSSPQVAFRFQPLFSYAFKDRIGVKSTRAEILRFFEDLMGTDDAFVLQRDPAIHVDYPELDESPTATHLVMKEVRYNNIIRNLIAQVPEVKVVGLVRHPCAVIDSWIHAPREFKPEWSVAQQWRSGSLKNQGRPEEFFGFDKWKEAAILFMELERTHPRQMKVVRYADLNLSPAPVVKNIFDFCGLDFDPRTDAFLRASRSRQGTDANSVYRLERADDVWKDRLPEYVSTAIHHDLAGTVLERFL